MIPELGQFAMIIGLVMAVVLGTLPLWGAYRGNTALIALAGPAAYGQLTFVGLAFVALTYAFVTQDLSVAYVAQNSNLLLPVPYRISAVWGAHEGSMLLWVLILALWTALVAAFSRALPAAYRARVLAVMGLISVGFLLFLVLTSNPFLRFVPAPADGRDLNPLLQDPGLIVHPPMLYLGYVGFSVAFAFAVAALLEGRLDNTWARWSRPWTNVAWACLTLGIALGSWWAYYELGWGGWWFWDPVENASFMPWLAGTALIHSQTVTEKRGAFKSWTVLLAISAFSLSLLGTFLVRSGVLTSVHAFATDPERGLFILVFLAIVVGGSLLLYALRAPRVAAGGIFGWQSKETLLLGNNLFLAAATFMVLAGTLYPLLADAAGWGKISVGPPYFGFMFTLLVAPLIVMLPLGPYSRWQEDSLVRVLRLLKIEAIVSVAVGLGCWLMIDDLPIIGGLSLGGATWIGLVSVRYQRQRARRVQGKLPRAVTGMTLAHLGVGFFLVGVTLVTHTDTERDVAMRAGDEVEIGGHRFVFQGVEREQGPNYVADEGRFSAFKGTTRVAELYPQKRAYSRGGDIMTEAAIDAGLTRDLYVSLGEPLGDGAWGVRVYHKPFIRWIWFGALLMGMGGILAATDQRYRAAAKRRGTVASPASGSAAA